MKKALLTLLTFMSMNVAVCAQYLQQYSQAVNYTPSVESFQMTKYGNTIPALYTGAMQLSQPLFTYQDPDFTIPVSLEYIFDGYRPFQGSGTVGLGWALSCGGVITREIRGYEDERHEYLGEIEVLNDGTLRHVYTAGYYRYCNRDPQAEYVSYRIARRGSPQPILNTPTGELYVFQNDFYNDIAIKEYVNPNLAGNAREWFDIEPDMFHFNFLGISGSFIFTEDGVQVFNCSRPLHEISISASLSHHSPTGNGMTFDFTIDTGDGYKYVFGGADGTYEHTKSFLYSHEGNTNYDYKTANPDEAYAAINTHVTGWRLQKIIAPNGREMTFSYRNKADYYVTVDWTYTPHSWYALKNNYNTVQTQVFRKKTFHSTFSYPLESVSISSVSGSEHEVISLSYNPVSDAENDCSPLCFVDNYDAQSFITNQLGTAERVKLSSVTLKGIDGSTADHATLTQASMGSASGMRKMVLSELTQAKHGTHSFMYMATSLELPKHGSYYVDLWGFWDNSETDVRYLNASSNLLDVSSIVDVNRQKDALNLSKTSTGGLFRITHPTGGYTNIVYEQNTASRLIERNGTAVPTLTDLPYIGPSMLAWQGTPVGGVRVSRLMKYSQDGISENIEYSYYSSTNGTGILMNVPRYCHEIQYIRYFIAATGPDICQYVRCPGYHTTFSSTTDVFQSRIFGASPTHLSYDRHIAYPEVTEHLPDGSKKVYSFTNAGDNLIGDYYIYNSSYSNHDYSADSAPPDQNEKTRTTYLTLSPKQINSALRGKLKSVKTYNSSGQLANSIDYTYAGYLDLHINCRHNMMTFWMEDTHDYSSSVLSYTTETSYYDLEDGSRGQTSKSHQIVYNENTRQRKYEKISTDGESRYTYYRYCHETPGAAGMSLYPSAVADIAQTVIRGSSEKVINRAHLTYSGNNPSPVTITEYLNDEPPVKSSDIWSTATGTSWPTTYSYNSLYRPSNVSLPGSSNIIIGWDSEGRYMTSRSVNGNTTSWTWKDQVGLLSATFPTGQKETYGYDNAGRLNRVANTYGQDVSRWTYNIGSAAGNSIKTRKCISTSGSYVTDIDFYNGFGYLLQSKGLNSTPSGKTLVKHVQYDSMRRPDAKDNLPFVVDDYSETITTGAAEKQAEWYAENFNGETAPYITKEYEYAGEGSRVTSQTRQGSVYRNAGKQVTYSYSMNSDSDTVLDISYNGYSSGAGSINICGFIAPGKLAKTTSVSEDGEITSSFTDGFGRTVLTRRLSGGIKHDTYFIRDVRDSLVCVIPPEGSAALPTQGTVAFNTDLAKKHFFTWRYDARGNLTASSVPGAGVCNYGYDNRNRLISFRDAAMAVPYVSLQYQYDNNDRLIVEGYISPQFGSAVVKIRTCDYWGSTLPTGASASDLAFASVSGVAVSTDVDTQHCKNLIAYECLGDGLPIERRYWYDRYGRVIQIVQKDATTGLHSRHSFKYDFVGNVTAECEQHSRLQSTEIKLTKSNTYDTRGRLVSSAITLNGSNAVNIVYSYDELGNLVRRSVKDGYIAESYTYNVQGFMTEAKTAGIICGPRGYPLYSENMRYYDPQMSASEARYGGSCCESQITYALQTGQLSFTDFYYYDQLNRLTDAIRDNDGEVIADAFQSYDRNSNIVSKTSWGSGVPTDVFSFIRSGNQITNAVTSTGDISGQYAYDPSGRMTTDGLRGQYYTYTYKGMTESVSDITGVPLVTYSYLEDGTKRSETYTDGSGRIYDGALECTFAGGLMQNAVPDIVHFGDGIYKRKPDGTWQTLWFVKDRTGSVVSVVDISSTIKNITHDGVIVSQMGYTPYGTEIASEEFAQDNTLRYRYAGKERQDGTITPSIINFGARMYDPLTSSWLAPDPLAHKYTSLSPYVYCAGNPVSFVDPDGKLYKKKIRGRSIIISAHYYVKRYDKESYRSAIIATDFWNKRKDTYISPSGIRYSVMYNLSVEVVDNLDTFQNHNNTYQVVKSLDERPNASGASKHKRTIYVLESYSLFLPKTKKISTTGAHEIGHTLGMSHDYYGIMSESQDQHRTNEVTSKNIRQMLESGEGIQDILTSIINIISKVYEQKK